MREIRPEWELVVERRCWVRRYADGEVAALVPARCALGESTVVSVLPDERRAMEYADERLAREERPAADGPIVCAEEIDLTPSDEVILDRVWDQVRREHEAARAAAAVRAEQLRTNARTIRAATLSDAAAVAAAWPGEGLRRPTEIDDVRRRLARALQDGGQAVFVSQLGDEVVGWVHVGVVDSLFTEPTAEVRGLLVAELQRRHGIGRALVEAAADWARARGLDALRVASGSLGTDEPPFWERVGFEHHPAHLAARRPL